MRSTATPNQVVAPLLSPGWLSADTSAQQATGRVPVTADDTAPLPNPAVPVGDDVVDYGQLPGPGDAGEAWSTTTDFPWPAVPANGDGIVAVTPGSTGNGNGNDDPSGMPGYDGPRLAYGGAYADITQQGGLDATAQQTTAWGFNVMTPGANMGYQRNETRMLGNRSPGYVNVWNKIRSVVPARKTANQFTAAPLTSMAGEPGTLPPFASLGLSNSGGPAYYVDGPAAPQVSQAAPTGTAADPAAGWA